MFKTCILRLFGKHKALEAKSIPEGDWERTERKYAGLGDTCLAKRRQADQALPAPHIEDGTSALRLLWSGGLFLKSRELRSCQLIAVILTERDYPVGDRHELTIDTR